MTNVYIIAGQSNANNIADELAAALRSRDPGCTIVQVAQAGAPLTWGRAEGDWYHSEELLATLSSEVTAALQADPAARLAGLVWAQGEADTLDCARADAYSEDLSALLAALRENLTASLPERAADVSSFVTIPLLLSAFAPAAEGRDNWESVRQEMLDFAAHNDLVSLLNVDFVAATAGIAAGEMFRDNLHYCAALVDTLAEAIAARLDGSPVAGFDQGVVYGTSGADTMGLAPAPAGTAAAPVSGAAGGVVLAGLDGNDTYIVERFDTLILETSRGGWDRAVVSSNYDMLHWAAEVETVQIAGATGLLVTGNRLANVMDGNAGNDTMKGGGGNDLIRGGEGADLLRGDVGNDTLRGGNGADTLIGGAGDDSLEGGSGSEDLRDLIDGGDGDDRIDGGYGNDSLLGGSGNDTILGGPGVDSLVGGAGDDMLAGGACCDLIFGGDGDDFINGGFGSDRLNGGAGADLFFHSGTPGHGSDWIQDYTGADGDVLVFGLASAQEADFRLQFGQATGAGDASVPEAFVIYRPTGQIVWTLIDGAGMDHIWLQIGDASYDLLA